MIEVIEGVFRHWAEQIASNGSAGGLGSTLSTIMEYGGCAPRGGVYGDKVLLAGAGPDYLAGEVTAALSTLLATKEGAVLHRLAGARYLNDLTLEQQCDVLELGKGDAARRAYFRHLDRLHHLVQAELLARQERLRGRRRESAREGAKVRAAAVRQAKAAHRARGVELFKGEKS
jgi:hypothetical protein